MRIKNGCKIISFIMKHKIFFCISIHLFAIRHDCTRQPRRALSVTPLPATATLATTAVTSALQKP